MFIVFLMYCYYYSVMYVTVMPVIGYIALAFVFGFIQINKLMMMNKSIFDDDCPSPAENHVFTLCMAENVSLHFCVSVCVSACLCVAMTRSSHSRMCSFKTVVADLQATRRCSAPPRHRVPHARNPTPGNHLPLAGSDL